MDRARVVATSQVAYPEACAALAKKHMQGDFTDELYRAVIDNLQQDWGAYFALDVSWAVAKLAGQYRFRAFDSIYLASAVTIKTRLRSTVTFSSSDRKLEDAAHAESLHVAERQLHRLHL